VYSFQIIKRIYILFTKFLRMHFFINFSVVFVSFPLLYAAVEKVKSDMYMFIGDYVVMK